MVLVIVMESMRGEREREAILGNKKEEKGSRVRSGIDDGDRKEW